MHVRDHLKKAFEYEKLRSSSLSLPQRSNQAAIQSNENTNVPSVTTKLSQKLLESIQTDFYDFIQSDRWSKMLSWDFDYFQGGQFIESALAKAVDLNSQNQQLPVNIFEEISRSFIRAELLQFLKVARYYTEGENESKNRIDLLCEKLVLLLLPIVNQALGVYLSKILNTRSKKERQLKKCFDSVIESNPTPDPNTKLIEYAHWCLNHPSIHIGWKLFVEFAGQICGNQISTSTDPSFMGIKENRQRWKQLFALIFELLPELNRGTVGTSNYLFDLSKPLPLEMLAKIEELVNSPTGLPETPDSRIVNNQPTHSKEFKLCHHEVKFLAQIFVYDYFQTINSNEKINLDSIVDVLSNYTDNIQAKALVWSAYTSLLTLKSHEQKILEYTSSLQETLSAATFEQIPNTNSLLVVLGDKHNTISLPDFSDPANASEFQNWLEISGFNRFLEKAFESLNLDNIDLDKPINVAVSGFDGSLEVPSNMEIFRRRFTFPAVETKLKIRDKVRGVGITIKDKNHHSPIPINRMLDESASWQTVEELPCSDSEDIVETTNIVHFYISQSKTAADNDMILTIISSYLRDSNREFAKKYHPQIKLLATIINQIDKTGGAPNINVDGLNSREQKLAKVSKYLNLQWIFLPYGTRTTLDRSLYPDLTVFKISELDKRVFTAFVEFMKNQNLDISSPEKFIDDFYSKLKESEFKSELENMFVNINLPAVFTEFIARTNMLEELPTSCYQGELQIKNEESEYEIFSVNLGLEKSLDVAFLYAGEQITTKAYLRSACKANIVFLPKSKKLTQHPKDQIVTQGVLEYDQETLYLNSLLSNTLSILWDLLNNTEINNGISYIQGGAMGGSRDSGTGAWKHSDNKVLIKLSVEAINTLIREGNPLLTITPKMVTNRIWYDKNGQVNHKAIQEIEKVMQNNIFEAGKLKLKEKINQVANSTYC